MFGPWPWFIGGVALALVVLVHGVLLRHLVQVSGRVSALVDRIRLGPRDDDEELDAEDLLDALRQETLQLAASMAEDGDLNAEEVLHALRREKARLTAEPGEGAPAPDPTPAPSVADLSLPSRPRPLEHVAFFAGLVLGGFVAAMGAGTWAPVATLAGTGFERAFGSVPVPALLFGGVLVGFGTRMCGGCTSGHGLCGLGRLQPGSALATAAFFGGGILATALVGGLSW